MKTLPLLLVALFVLGTTSKGQTVWTLRNSPAATGLRRPAGKAGVYLVPTADASGTRYLRSTDGAAWNQVTLPNSEIPLVCFNNRIVGFQRIAQPYGVWYSDNGTSSSRSSHAGLSATQIQNIIPEGSLYGSPIAYGNGIWILTDTSGRVHRSTNNCVDFYTFPTPASQLGSIVFGGGKFIAYAQQGAASIISTDGLTWEIGPQIPGTDMIFVGNKFRTIRHGSDGGRVWTVLPQAEQLPNVFGTPLVVGNGIALTWDDAQQPTFQVLESGAWGGPSPSGVLSRIEGATLCGDMWVAATNSNRILTSPTPVLPPPETPVLNITSALRLSWASLANRSYVIQRSVNNQAWTDVSGIMLGTGSTMEWLAPASAAKEFFRVVVR